MNRDSGFTAIELLVTIAIVGILAAIAIPSFAALIRDNRATTQGNEFAAAVAMARQEAIKRGVNVTLCRSNNGSTCAAGAGWETGWIIFPDPAVAGTRDTSYDTNCTALDANGRPIAECVIQTRGRFGSTQSYLRGNNNVANRITFTDQGMAVGFNGQLIVCDSQHPESTRYITISATGRTQVSKTATTPANAPSCPQ